MPVPEAPQDGLPDATNFFLGPPITTRLWVARSYPTRDSRSHNLTSMSGSPSRLTRRSLPASAFSHTPSKLSKSHSSLALASEDTQEGDNETLPDHVGSAPGAGRAAAGSGRLTKLNGRAPTSAPRHTSASAQTSSSDDADPAVHTPLRHRALALGTPSTPKLTYSPNATDVPPPSLSKSASIPFDMAASARAARVAQQERSESSSSLNTVGTGKKKRFIRKKPLLERSAAAVDVTDQADKSQISQYAPRLD